MEKSFNCLLLRNTNNTSLFPVAVFKDKDERFVIFGQQSINLNVLTVVLLRDYICEKKKVDNSDDMKLWKVNFDEEKIKDKNVLTEDDIVKELNGNELKPQKLFIEYFQAELDNQVKFTATFTSSLSLLPDQLEFRNPHPLLIGSGSIWDFQASIALREKLKDAIHDHYKFWKAGQREKTKIPEYFILAGAEEGKSRTAQELPRLLIECADSDADLQNRLKDALVFNLSFENGTKLIRGDEITSSKAICNRMLFQLLKLPNDSWNDFKNRYDVTPEDVLRRIAKHRTQEFKDLNVIIILDGLQVAMDDTKDGKNKSKNLFFYDCISTLGILSLTGPFVIVCCTATISIPIHDFLASSQQKRIFLPVTSSQPPKINNIPVFNDSSTMNMFIDDMGGHGRALEALGEAVVNKDMNKLNYIDLINNVRMNLTYN